MSRERFPQVAEGAGPDWRRSGWWRWQEGPAHLFGNASWRSTNCLASLSKSRGCWYEPPVLSGEASVRWWSEYSVSYTPPDYVAESYPKLGAIGRLLFASVLSMPRHAVSEVFSCVRSSSRCCRRHHHRLQLVRPFCPCKTHITIRQLFHLLHSSIRIVTPHSWITLFNTHCYIVEYLFRIFRTIL